MVSRRKFCTIFSGALVAAAAPDYSNTPGLLRNAGDIRIIKLKNNKTSEKINLGSRIRDIKVLPNGKIMMVSDEQKLIYLQRPTNDFQKATNQLRIID